MDTVLVVDDDDAIRRLIQLNLAADYRVFDTAEPERALALALEHKPDAILLDLRMPGYSGFQLCQTFASFNSTQLIPIVVISGEAGARTKELCRDLGAAAYFEKPVDFDALRAKLAGLLQARRKERRSEVRVRLRAPIRLAGVDHKGASFDIVTSTENVARSSFLCAVAVNLETGCSMEMHLRSRGGEEACVGRVEVIRSERDDPDYPRYACRLREKSGDWILQ